MILFAALAKALHAAGPTGRAVVKLHKGFGLQGKDCVFCEGDYGAWLDVLNFSVDGQIVGGP
ncbi:hypothetical protein Z945_590 [Sulfitobacter noctilucae]|nr:hypothetical protein Z945_590 [Sulfitobacter noctilucae]